MNRHSRLNDVLHEERVVPGGPGFAAHLARYRRASEVMGDPSLVLDIGCGTGYGVDLLAAEGHTVVGIDASATAIRFAVTKYGARLVVGDACRLPFPAQGFDVATCFEVIEHVENPEELIEEASRILKPGGLLVLSTPHGRMERLHNRSPRTPHYHYHVSPLTPRVLLKILRRRFRRVRLVGQTPDLGLIHLILKSVDVLGLRLRIPRERQETIRHTLAAISHGRPSVPEAMETFRFSRLAGRSAAITYVEAIK